MLCGEFQSLRIEGAGAFMVSFDRRKPRPHREAVAESGAVADSTHQRQRLVEIAYRSFPPWSNASSASSTPAPRRLLLLLLTYRKRSIFL